MAMHWNGCHCPWTSTSIQAQVLKQLKVHLSQWMCNLKLDVSKGTVTFLVCNFEGQGLKKAVSIPSNIASSESAPVSWCQLGMNCMVYYLIIIIGDFLEPSDYLSPICIDLGLDPLRILINHLLRPYTRPPTCHIAGKRERLCPVLIFTINQSTTLQQPHLVSIYDCITINSIPVSPPSYETAHTWLKKTLRRVLTGVLSRFWYVEGVWEGTSGYSSCWGISVIPDEAILVSALTAVDLDRQTFAICIGIPKPGSCWRCGSFGSRGRGWSNINSCDSGCQTWLG